ncbi:hypothetical protein [Streptomyces sp. NPDC007205]|uniref:hypothetical protein n=1 Tax=Streptomyces sp. NPDC007205 TaxID=3154316 RepID=UPI003407F958
MAAPPLLTDEALPTDVRAAGAITLLSGPSTERLCHLTPEHLKPGDKDTAATLLLVFPARSSPT